PALSQREREPTEERVLLPLPLGEGWGEGVLGYWVRIRESRSDFPDRSEAMATGSTIISVTARQVFSDRGHPGVEATVKTERGATGVAVCTAGISVGVHEVQFAYDGGTRWRGKGVQRAVDSVNTVIGPALLGLDASRQREVDDAMLNLGGPDAKLRLGGNATAAVSAAVLKAGAASLGIPLYQHIGGVNACIMPVPGVITVLGSRRYGSGSRSHPKPSYSLMCYGFGSFGEAAEAAWEAGTEFVQLMRKKYSLDPRQDFGVVVPPGFVQHDRELWDDMTSVIGRLGYEGKVGIQVDVAAATYYEKDKDKFVGLFSREEKSKDDLVELYQSMVKNWPFVIVEDPLDEVDYEGHALLTRLLGIQVVGDDLFTTNPERVQRGIELGAANTVLLKVNQIGTISEAFDMVQLAYRNGYGVMPCSSRGEGADIADYTVGLGTGHLREGAVGPTGNRFLKIEAELGSRAKFLGRKGLKP
ncbi:MAG TPA: enolase C-terminal domain-like protein, partial [Chloroflexota bacterium]|nr:enolase C-terminal domain-like protein [Chloroflexota bacterium]